MLIAVLFLDYMYCVCNAAVLQNSEEAVQAQGSALNKLSDEPAQGSA